MATVFEAGPPAAAVSLAEYLSSDYEPGAEFVDGTIEQRPAGERDRAAWQKAILDGFTQHEEPWRV